MQKKVLAIHDISCVGRCSLTVALPIISACGIECSVLPTSVLSTHTGGFTGYTFRDLTEDIDPIVVHWQQLQLQFDGIYSGFLGSRQQIDKVENIIKQLKTENGLACVDPCMADNGKLYPLFDLEYAKCMTGLCQKADLIVPNITEACLLTGQSYQPGPYQQSDIEELLKKLVALGPKMVILTGVYFDDQQLGAACCTAGDETASYAMAPRLPGYYHGTGDVFASVAFAALINGASLKQANQLAVTYTQKCIARTYQEKTDIRFGVNFESGLAELGSQMKEIG